METMLSIKNLSKSYKNKKVLSNININVFKGDIYGFIGPNGAGKTTTIKIILGLLKASGGKVYLEGKDILHNKVIDSNIGAMIDYPSFYPNLSGYKNLMLYTNALNLNKKRVDEVLDIVNLSNDKNKKVKNYSMGMKQRLAVARAFLTTPKIVILDEPTNGLDPEGVKEMRELIKKLVKTHNTTFIYCSHILNEVENLCNRVAIINKGNVVVEDTIENLLNSKNESYDILTDEKAKTRNLLKDSVVKIIDIDNGVRVEINKGDFNLINNLIVKNNINITTISKNNNSLENYFIDTIGM